MDITASLGWIGAADERVLDPVIATRNLQIVYIPGDDTQCLSTLIVPTTSFSSVEWSAVETALGPARPISAAYLFQAGRDVRDVLTHGRTPERCLSPVRIGDVVTLEPVSRCMESFTTLFAVGPTRPRPQTRRSRNSKKPRAFSRRRQPT